MNAVTPLPARANAARMGSAATVAKHLQTLDQHVIEIMSDSGEGAQKCGQSFGSIAARTGNGVWTVEIIPAEIQPPARSVAGASGNRIRIGSQQITNGGDEADCSRKQRLRDSRRDHRKRGVLRGRDRLEACHDAPDGAEQPDKGCRRPRCCQEQEPRFNRAHFLLDLHIDDFFNALLHALEAAPPRRILAPLPLAHCRPENRRKAQVGTRSPGAIETPQRLARPEALLEPVIGRVHPAHREILLDDDRPAPDRGQGQAHHDEKHRPAGLHDQMPERNLP